MTNLSDLTRRDQVLKRLQDARGEWVDGADLSNAECGGSEGLKRLRELRQPQFGGHSIKMRQKPGSDQFQYRIEVKPAGPAVVDAAVTVTSPPAQVIRDDFTGKPLTPRTDLPRHEFKPYAGTNWAVCDECHQVPEAEGAHHKPIITPADVDPVERYERPVKDYANRRNDVHLGKTPDGTFVVVNDTPPPVAPDEPIVEPPSPGQTDLGVTPQPWFKFEKMPTHLDMGTMRLCPLCGGHRKPIHQLDADGKVVMVSGPKGALKKKVIGYEEFSMDPRTGHKDERCERCNGFGIVPA